jgi:hypothetical protein
MTGYSFYLTSATAPPFRSPEEGHGRHPGRHRRRPVGGLGIFFIKEMTDGVTERPAKQKNILTIKMKR